jgi:hypothetical protein
MSSESVRNSLRRIKSIFAARKSSSRPSGRRRRAILKVESLEERLVLSTVVLGQQPGAPNNTVFHDDAAGTGFDENETVLTPANVASSFGQVWQSPVLDGAVYATPLSMDSLLIKDAISGVNGNAAKNAGDGIQNATFMGKTLGVVFGATGGGSVYCIAAQDTDGPTGIAPGTILWKTHLGNPYAGVDGNSIGVLSTPVIDLASGRLYVTASVTDYLSPSSNPNHGGNNFEVFALNLSDGSLVAGYPLIYTQALLDAVNQNYLASPTHSIASASVSAGVVTIATSAANGFSAGQTAVIAGVGSGYDGTFTITGVNANNNTFTYSDANASGAIINSGTALTKVAVVFSSSGADQRGALKLNSDGSTLYVDFACYGASNGGWMTAVATGVTGGALNGQTPAIVSAYSSIDTTAVIANGGMWGAGGPVIDANGNVFVTTGDSPSGTGNPLGTWGNSVLEWGPGQTLTLTGVYTPWNYESQDTIDSDMGGGSPILITLPDGSSTTTELLATGGKQGNGYLVDAGNNLNNPTPNPNNSPASYPASLTQRPPATESPDQDASLYELGAAGIRTYWTKNNQGQTVGPQDGPLALFGPYNESSASGNTAKARDTPATFTGPDGNQYIIWAGATKAGVGSSTPVAPSLIETEVVHSPGQPAYLQIVAQNTGVMSNPGSNLITGNGTSNEIDWVVDEGQQRTDGTTSFSDGSSVLYAYNALTLQPLWNSAYEELDVPDGKYNSIAVARGDVYVGTNRIQAFGLTTNTIVDDSAAGTGTNQFNYVGSGWTHVTGSSTMGTFDGTVSTDNAQGDFATLQFTGSAISVYANELTTYGTATFSIDGGNMQTVTLRPANSSPNGAGAGNVLVYTVSGLSAGTHTLKILNNAASNIISIDRVQIAPPATTHASLSISMTDGNVVPVAMGVVPYTINYTNAGSIVKSTGVNATGVVLTETVQVNTTADLANSTPGWTLVSGNGGAGSIYTFSVDNLNAGVTGSVVFSVDLNASIPLGTTTVSDDVSISDAASDTATATRTTPIPPPAESQLIFSQEPPTNGSAGIALSPAVTVSVEDQFGNIYTADSSSTVQLTLNGGTFSGGGDTATATVANGVATFSTLVITSSGTYTLTATDGALSGVNSSSFFIANSAKLGFLQQPTQTTAGVAIGPDVTVAVEDQSGNTITTDASTVILTINQGSFANGSTTVAAQAMNGVATFNNLVIDAANSYTLVATDGGLQQGQSNSFNIVAIASQLVFTQQPSGTYLGEAVNPYVAVALEDQFGNIATGDTSNVTLTLNGGTLFGGGTTATVAAINGVASFDNLVVIATGTYSLTATDSDLPSATSNSFAIGTHALTTIDDNNADNTGTIPQVAYTGSWAQSASSLANNYGDTVTSDGTGGDNASVTFTGTLITLYAVESPTAGSAQVFIDGNDPIQIDLFSSTAMIAPVFTSALLTAGSHTIIVKVASGDVAIDDFVVGPATPTLAWATPADLVYGTALTGTQLDAYVSNYANFPGTFTYAPPLGTMLPVGQYEPLTVTFVPTDTADYATASAQVLVNVAKATPLITWTGPDTDMFYGQAISSAQLNATATVDGVTVPGNFVYTPDIGTVPPTGADFELSLTFTPTNTTDYATVTVEQNVDVDPATPVIMWANPADIIDGTALSSTQLDATANVPGTFVYTPAAGTVLPEGQSQSLGVFFTPTDSTDYSSVGASANLNVDYGMAAKLAFVQQPTAAASATIIAPAVTVAVEDSVGTTLPDDDSTITLTLSSGTFVGGGTTVTVQAVDGIATFDSLAIANNGSYTLTATDGSLSSALSNTFTIGSTAFVNFNTDPTDFTAQFAVNLTGVAGGTSLNWNGSAGVDDQAGGTAGGGIQTSAVSTDETAVYTPTTFSLSDGNVHTISIFLNAAGGLNTNDRNQLGFLTSSTAGLNGGYSFISARIYGNDSINFQYDNGASTATTVGAEILPTGVSTGDWLQLVFTAQETASGSFTLTESLLDYGASGTAAPTMVIAPVTTTVSGLTTIGMGTGMYAGFRTATGGEFTTPLDFDNFGVDLPPAKMAYLTQPSIGVAGATMNPFVVALEDSSGNIVVGDSSAVTLTLTHGTYSNGQSSVTANAVNGIATFNNLVISTPDSYSLRATDANPNLDPGFGPVTVVELPAVTTQPTNQVANAGDTATFTAAASGSPAPAVQWQVSTDGGATFSDISGATSTTLTLSDVDSSLNNNEYRAVFTVSVNSQSVGTATTNAATLNITTAPAVTTQPANQNLFAGATATFTAAASGFPTPGVQWYVNANDGAGFTPISGATSTTLTLTNAGTSQNGYSYEAVFTSSAGAITTTAAALTVKTAPVITWANPADITDSTPLSTTQLDATANVPGIFVYSPAAGTFLSAGQQQALTVTFTPTDSVDYGSVSATAYVNVNDGAPTALTFTQKPPTATASSANFSTDVIVAVEDAVGATVTGDASTVTLTLSSGTFASGGTTVTAQAVNGVATFSNLAIANTGNYTLTATDGSLTSAVSNGFYIGASAFVNFDAIATTFTSQFAVNISGTPGGTDFKWVAADGVDDQTGPAAGGGISSTNEADQTAIYTPTTFNLSDGLIHTVSEFVTAPSGAGSGDRLLQIGFVSTSTSGFNSGFSFLSARLYGNHSAEVQTGNGSGTSSVSIDTTSATGTINAGDWLQLVFTTQETASGSFQGTFSLFDYGPTGVSAPTTVLAAVPYSVTGLTTLGTASAVYAGFRSIVSESLAAGALQFDNFAVDQLPSVPTVSISPSSKSVRAGNSTSFFAAANGNSAQSVQWRVSTNGGATFMNLSNGGVYSGATTMTLSISNTNIPTNLNGYLYQAVFANSAGAAISTAAALSLTGSSGQTYPSVTTPPANPTIVNAGNNATITAAASGKASGTGGGNLSVQWRVSMDGGVSFSNLTNGDGTYSWTATITSAGSPVSDTLIITGATPSLNGNIYDAVFTNSLGAASSGPSTLIVETAPAVTTQPSSQTVDIGTLVAFTAAASGNPPPTVEWQVSTDGGSSWSNINGATSATLTFNSVSASQAGNEYRAIFANSVTTVTTNAATLTLNTNLAVLSAPYSPAPRGAALSFTAMIAGRPNVGSVSFYVGSVTQENQIGTAVGVSGGAATSAAINNLSPGIDTIIAVYSGGTGFVGSQAAMPITINPDVPALVTSSSDSGDGSLRQALLDAVVAPGFAHTLQFELAAGAQTIDLLSPLPTLADPIIVDVDASQNVTIVGSSSIAWTNTQTFELSGAGSLTFGGGIDGAGDLVVDAGGSLTASQIQANSLVIGAGATVTIAPSGAGISMVATSAASDVQTSAGAGGTTLAERIAAIAARRAQVIASLLATEDRQAVTANPTALADSGLIAAPVVTTSIVLAAPAAAPVAVAPDSHTSAPTAMKLTPAVSGNPPPMPSPGKPLSVFPAAVPPLEVFTLPAVPALTENPAKLQLPATLDFSSPSPLVDAFAKDQQGAAMQFNARFLNPQAVDVVFGGDSSSLVEENAVEMLIATIDNLDSLDD